LLVKLKYFVFLLLVAVTLPLVLQSCSSSSKTDIKTDDPEQAFKTAKRNFDKRDYLQAIEDFSFIKIKFSGTKIMDRSQFYLAMCYYNRKEYILSAYEFEYLIKNYPTSEFQVQARYYLAMSYYQLSPSSDLDQIYTRYAITEFQNFLELYPKDVNAADSRNRIRELRDKLAYKEYRNAELYMAMGNYKAAIIYYEKTLQDYFDSSWADYALLGKIKALIAREKNDLALKEIERFEKKFGDSKLLQQVLGIKNNLKP